MAESSVDFSINYALGESRGAPIRVLQVDDDACFLKTAKSILEKQGAFQVETASSVEEAAEKMKKEEYDAVVSDYQMPGKDGLQFLEELRKSGNGIPFIVFTGKGREEVAIRALNLGADGYINKQGSPETVYGELAHSVKSVVARHKAEEALRSSEEKYRAYVENSPVAFFVANSEWKYEQANDAACKLLGYSKEELLQMTATDVVFEEDTPLAFKHRSKLERTGKSRVEFKLKRKNGEPVHVILNTVKLPNGKKIAFCEDITEHKKTEEALHEIEEGFRAIIESAPVGYYCVGKDGLWQYVNPMWERMHGLSLEEVVGKRFEITQTGDDVELAKEYVRRALAGETIVGEFSRLTGKGDVAYHSFNIQPVKRDNEIVAIEGFINDITERKKVEEELRIQRKELQVILDSLPAKTWYKDGNNRLVRVNKAFADYMGVSKENLEGKPLCDLFPPDIAQKCWEEDKEVIATGQPKIDILDRHESAQGVRWFLTSKVPCSDKDGNIIGTINFSVDITERKKTEEELARSEAKYRSLVDQSLQGMVIAQGVPPRVVFVNPTMIQMSGYTSEELASIPMERLIHPDDRPAFFSRLKDRSEGKSATSSNEYRAIRKDGKVVWIDVSSSCIEYNGQPAVQATFMDITERKKVLERLRVLNEKLDVVGKLTRHDVRNKLSSVINNVYLAKQSLPEGPKALAYLRDIELACEQTTRTLDFAAAYESLGVEELTLMDVGKAVEEAVSLVSELKGVKVVNNCHGLTVMADSALVRLFFNLIENSLKHGKNASEIKIHYEEGADRLKLFCEDNGVGIPKANKPKLFDWGFTTGNGSGYGLPITKRMMEIYGWTIEEEGEPGKGAKFVMTIPKTHTAMRARNA